MNVAISIAGREAVPVRALPLINPEQLNPERVVADLLQEQSAFRVLLGLVAYTLDPSGKPAALPPIQWRPMRDRVFALSDELDRRGLARPQLGTDYPPRDVVYNYEILPRLPSGVFVWRDDLEAGYSPPWCNKERAASDWPLCFTPIADANTATLVLEGFERFVGQSSAPAPRRYTGSTADKPTQGTDMIKVFISYSHQNEAWKNRVVKHLRVLASEGLRVWHDREIAAGDEWADEIDTAIATCDVAVLLISADFLTSRFILEQEVPMLLERRQMQGIRVIPVIISPCAWKYVPWLKSIQVSPNDGRPLSDMSRHAADAALVALTEEIRGLHRGRLHHLEASRLIMGGRQAL